MAFFRKLGSLLNNLVGSEQKDADLHEEVNSHFQMMVEENIGTGMSRHEAERAARIELGGAEQIKEHVREVRLGNWFQSVVADVRYGFRQMRKHPGFTAVTVLTLALGIGANASIFSLVNAVMLGAIPVRDADSLVLLNWRAAQSPDLHNASTWGDCVNEFRRIAPYGCSLPKPFLDEVRAKTSVFSGMAEFAGDERLNLSGNGPATLAVSEYVSGDFFDTLGIEAATGRVLHAFDDAPNAPAVVVLDYGYWKSSFGGDPRVVGITIHLNGHPFTIAGVTEQPFTSLTPGNARDVYVPLIQRPRVHREWTAHDDDAGSFWLSCVGRLKPGVTTGQAQARLTQLFYNSLVNGERLSKPEDDPSIYLQPVQAGLTGTRQSYAQPLYILLLAVGVVLLIACTNIAGLMLARSTAREKEIAVRLALGARRARIARQLFIESITLSFVGGAFGVLISFWGSRALLAVIAGTSDRPLGFTARIDFRVLAFTLAATLLTGILFGLAPALRSIRVDLVPSLKEGGGKGSNRESVGRGLLASGSALVVAQVALTTVVLVGAGLLLHTLQNLKNVNPGFDTNNILNFGIDTTLTGYKGPQLSGLYSELSGRFKTIPGVTSVSYSETPLLSGNLNTEGFHLPGTPPSDDAYADYLPVGPGFFETMRIPLLSGRGFLPSEFLAAAQASVLRQGNHLEAPIPAIVNEKFVSSYFPSVNPIGQPFGANTDGQANPGWVIVGVVRNVKDRDLKREIMPAMYVPIGEDGYFEIRTSGDPLTIVSSVRDVVRDAGGDMPIYDIKTETRRIDDLLFQVRTVARLSSMFGTLALLLVCIGLYGLLSYQVTRRTQEIGVRMALGATAGSVQGQIVGRGLALAGIGALIGATIAFVVTRYLQTALYEVKPHDPLTIGGVLALLLLVTLAASYIPARRATRIDPMAALHYE